MKYKLFNVLQTFILAIDSNRLKKIKREYKVNINLELILYATLLCLLDVCKKILNSYVILMNCHLSRLHVKPGFANKFSGYEFS